MNLQSFKQRLSLAVCAVYNALLFLTDIIPNRGLPAFMIGNETATYIVSKITDIMEIV